MEPYCGPQISAKCADPSRTSRSNAALTGHPWDQGRAAVMTWQQSRIATRGRCTAHISKVTKVTGKLQVFAFGKVKLEILGNSKVYYSLALKTAENLNLNTDMRFSVYLKCKLLYTKFILLF